MKLYVADYTGNPKNNVYPHCVEINSKRDFIQAVARDNMASQMKDGHRNTDNFLGCDCIMFDIDNTHTEDPGAWVTADDIGETFPVHYMLVRSRSYMKEKRKTDKKTGAVTITEPREKWHVYMPLSQPITDPANYSWLMTNILCLFPFLDPSAIDTARFFFGVPDPHVTFEQGEQYIDEYLKGRDPSELLQEQKEAIIEFSERIQNGTYIDNKYTRLIVRTGCSFLGIRDTLAPIGPDPAPIGATGTAPASGTDPERDGFLDWISEAEHRQALQWLEKWAAQYDVQLGRRYTITAGEHAGGVAICVTCPWEHEHSGGDWPDNESVIIVDRSGRYNYICRHSHGSALNWSVFRKYHESKGTPEQPQPTEQEPKPDNVAHYINNLMGSDLARFKKDIKTGYPNLDQESGGLYSGLYVLAAISSLGKTTFAHQMADQIAAAGNDVLFFSLEQSRLELVTKSIARHMAKKDINSAVTSLAIRKGYLPARVQDAIREYSEAVGDRLSIIEGNFNCTASFIGEYIRAYMDRNKAAETGDKPVVIVDYLQVIQPATEKRQTVKETVDATVTELKRISRDLDITIILISSVNRANYLTPIDFESLKESGGIEYTADVVWGLQLQCLNDPLFDKEKNIKEKREAVKRAKAAPVRKIELVCLKNRYGKPHYSCGFNYISAVDLFRMDAGADFAADPLPDNSRSTAPARRI